MGAHWWKVVRVCPFFSCTVNLFQKRQQIDQKSHSKNSFIRRLLSHRGQHMDSQSTSMLGSGSTYCRQINNPYYNRQHSNTQSSITASGELFHHYRHFSESEMPLIPPQTPVEELQLNLNDQTHLNPPYHTPVSPNSPDNQEVRTIDAVGEDGQTITKEVPAPPTIQVTESQWLNPVVESHSLITIDESVVLCIAPANGNK